MILSLCISFVCFAQVDPFEEYEKNQKAEFNKYKDSVAVDINRYRDSLNNAFAKYLANGWEKFNADEGIIRPQEPKPDKVPAVKPRAVLPASANLPIEEYKKLAEPIKPKPAPDLLPQTQPVQPALLNTQ